MVEGLDGEEYDPGQSLEELRAEIGNAGNVELYSVELYTDQSR